MNATTSSLDIGAANGLAASAASRHRWPWIGVGAGITGLIGTLLTDIHVDPPGNAATTAEIVQEVNQRTAHLSLVAGYLTVALLLVLAASWRRVVEPRVPGSTAAGVVTLGLTAAAGALMLGYGWKGATAIYHKDGMDAGEFDQTGLYVYYILNDFGSYIGWLGVTVAAGAIAWMGTRERTLPLWIGAVSCLPVLAVVGFAVVTGLPGFPGVVTPIWMVIAFAGLAFSHFGDNPATMPNRARTPRRTLD